MFSTIKFVLCMKIMCILKNSKIAEKKKKIKCAKSVVCSLFYGCEFLISVL